MADFHSSRTIARTRKPHRCEQCGKLIEPGSPAEYHRGAWEGGFYSHHLHPDCAEAARLFYDEFCAGRSGTWWPQFADGDFDATDHAWMRARFPAVAERLGWTEDDDG